MEGSVCDEAGDVWSRKEKDPLTNRTSTEILGELGQVSFDSTLLKGSVQSESMTLFDPENMNKGRTPLGKTFAIFDLYDQNKKLACGTIYSAKTGVRLEAMYYAPDGTALLLFNPSEAKDLQGSFDIIIKKQSNLASETDPSRRNLRRHDKEDEPYDDDIVLTDE